MLFHSSIRKELAKSFGATLLVLTTVVMTMTLIRTVGAASRGAFNPTDVLVIMGYSVLSDMPTILSLSLFIANLSVLTRMYKDSEMVIWFCGGMGLTSLVRPLFRFAWPILVVIAVLAFLILPWAFGRIEDLRDRYEKRSDIARVEPGQFQESANGDRVFFIEQNSISKQEGKNVFIATKDEGKETITSAHTGSVDVIGRDKFLLLQTGQRLERNLEKRDMNLSTFGRYGVRIGADDPTTRSYVPVNAISTMGLLQAPTPMHKGELSWRLGLVLAAINFVLFSIAASGMNPRAGRVANLGFSFLAYVVYFNLLVMGKSWLEAGSVDIGGLLLCLHGGAFALISLWLAKRHNRWVWLSALLRPRRRAAQRAMARGGA